MGKKSSNTISQTIYRDTTTSNPFVTSRTNNKGTTSSFVNGTALDTINNFVNNNINRVLDEYLNPSLSTVTNQNKINQFMDNLNASSAKNFENNIVNPLSRRNMIRSSQLINMANNLTNNNNAQIAEYLNNLLASSQKDSAAMLASLLALYMNGYSAISDNQAQSLATSSGNAIRSGSSGSSADYISQYGNQATNLATQLALTALGL